MAQRLLKAEGVDYNLPGATPQSSGNLAGKQRSRRTGQEQLHLLGIQQPAHEALPAGHRLYLVEAPDDGFSPPQCRKAPVVFLHQEMEMPGSQSRQPLILEVDVGHTLAVHAARQPLPPDLMQKHRLAHPPHAHHSRYLPVETHCPEDPARRAGGERRGQGVCQLFDELALKWIGQGGIHLLGYFIL